MAFVNERISEEDRKQYGLDEVWEKYKNDRTITLSGELHPFQWTIDKNKNIFAIRLARVIAEVHDHGCSYTREHWFLFYFQDEFFEVRLNREEKFVSNNEQSNGYVLGSIVYDVLSINPEPYNADVFKENLKQALEVYGKNGTFSENIKSQTTVVCNF